MGDICEAAETTNGGSVAVMIAARNASATIGRSVASALSQPEVREVIVVDDGSQDETADLARREDDGSGRLTVHGQPPAGPAAARNRAMAMSRAEWICPLDADDFMLPGRVARLLPQAQDCDLVADDLLLVDEGAESATPRSLIGHHAPTPLWLSLERFLDANVTRRGLARRELGYLKPLMRRSFLERSGLAYDMRLRLGEDFILYANALAKGARFKVVGPCGYVSVRRPDSLSHRHTTADLRALRQASLELARSPGLTPTEIAAARRHQRHVAAKIHYREVLDAKRARGLWAAVAVAVPRARSAPYIASELLNRRA